MSVAAGSIRGAVARFAVVAGAVCCAVALVTVGLAVCAFLPATTELLSRATSNDALSPFTKDELVIAAEATRDYTVATHDEAALYTAILSINESATADGRGDPRSLDAQIKSAGGDSDSRETIEAAAAEADEAYTLTPDAVSHLDDVNAVVSTAAAALIAALVVSLTCFVIVGVTGGARPIGAALIAAGTTVIALFALFGLWAILDFNGIFSALHALFFESGTWIFSNDSLLICMYPSAFWMGMGAIWLAVTVLLSALCIIAGVALRHHAKARAIVL